MRSHLCYDLKETKDPAKQKEDNANLQKLLDRDDLSI